MMCPVYDELRHTYLPHLEIVVKDITAFAMLMNSGYTITKSLAKYIYYVFELRRDKFVELAYARNSSLMLVYIF